MIRKLPFAFLGLFWGLGVFYVGLHLFFPSDTAVDRLEWEVSQLTGGEWVIKAASASPWRVSGISLADVEILKVEKKLRRQPTEDEEPAPAVRLAKLDRAAVRVHLFPLLGGDQVVTVDSDLFAGELEGVFGRTDGGFISEAGLEELDLSLVPIDGDTWSLDLGGLANADWELRVNQEDPRASSGRGRLSVDGLVMRSGTIAGFDLPENTEFQTAELEFKVQEGKATITSGRLVGDLVDLTAEGDLTLNKVFSRSRLRLQVTFTLEESLDNLVKILPGPREARSDDGRYHYMVTGTVQHPHARADASQVRPDRAARRPSVRPPPPRLPGPGTEEPGDADERKRLREERIRERRERLRERREARIRDRGASHERPGEFPDELPPEYFPPEDMPGDMYEDEDPPLDDGYEDDVDLQQVPYEGDYEDYEQGGEDMIEE